jgi:hypothetical protein
MKLSSTIEALAAIVVGLLAAISLVLVAGCTPQSTKWPPEAAFKRASISGHAVLATPGGPVTLDLATGILSGGDEAGVELVTLDLDGSVAFEVNGTSHDIELESRGSKPDSWAQCLTAKTTSHVGGPLLVKLLAIPPGLHESCGGPAFELKFVAAPEQEDEKSLP